MDVKVEYALRGIFAYRCDNIALADFLCYLCGVFRHIPSNQWALRGVFDVHLWDNNDVPLYHWIQGHYS